MLASSQESPVRRAARDEGPLARTDLVILRRHGETLVPEIPRNSEPRTGLSMGEHTAIMAAEWGIGREEQDELAATSHRHLAAAYDSGWMDDLVTPFLGLERDQNLRPAAAVRRCSSMAVYTSASTALRILAAGATSRDEPAPPALAAAPSSTGPETTGPLG